MLSKREAICYVMGVKDGIDAERRWGKGDCNLDFLIDHFTEKVTKCCEIDFAASDTKAVSDEIEEIVDKILSDEETEPQV